MSAGLARPGPSTSNQRISLTCSPLVSCCQWADSCFSAETSLWRMVTWAAVAPYTPPDNTHNRWSEQDKGRLYTHVTRLEIRSV